MEEIINDGGAAFPFHTQSGMSRRDWLAGLAMQGRLSKTDILGGFTSMTSFAEWCYGVSDAIIAAGDK